MQVKITPSPLAGAVQLPPSKSFAIRALICSALAGGGSVAPLGTSADIAATVQALADLAAGRDEIFCNESGSLVRFLIPVAAALGKSVTFTGVGRLPRRPLDAFATPAATARCAGTDRWGSALFCYWQAATRAV